MFDLSLGVAFILACLVIVFSVAYISARQTYASAYDDYSRPAPTSPPPSRARPPASPPVNRVDEAIHKTMQENWEIVSALRRRVRLLEEVLGPFVGHDDEDIEHELDGGLPNTVRIRITDDEYQAACAAMTLEKVDNRRSSEPQ